MDSSSFSAADQASGEPVETEVNIGMKPEYHNGAAKGKIEVFKDIPKPLDHLLTPNRNTILHIHLTSLITRSEDSESKDLGPEVSESSTAFVREMKGPEDSESPTAIVEEILRMCPSLLWQANVKGETPLHIAARYGHAAIVEVLIEHAKCPQQDLESGVNKTVKEMLETTNNEKDTALHEAIRNNHLEVVKLLIQEGPDFSYSRNEAGETSLYIVVERNYKDVAFHILDNCTSPAHDRPLGRTTLHAAVTWDDDNGNVYFFFQNSSMHG